MLAITLVLRREYGVLKRIRSTPLPRLSALRPWQNALEDYRKQAQAKGVAPEARDAFAAALLCGAPPAFGSFGSSFLPATPLTKSSRLTPSQALQRSLIARASPSEGLMR